MMTVLIQLIAVGLLTKSTVVYSMTISPTPTVPVTIVPNTTEPITAVANTTVPDTTVSTATVSTTTVPLNIEPLPTEPTTTVSTTTVQLTTVPTTAVQNLRTRKTTTPTTTMSPDTQVLETVKDAVRVAEKIYKISEPLVDMAKKLPAISAFVNATDTILTIGFGIFGLAAPTTTTISPILQGIQDTVDNIQADVLDLKDAVDRLHLTVKDLTNDLKQGLSHVEETVKTLGKEEAYRDFAEKYRETIWRKTNLLADKFADDMDFSTNKSRTSFREYCQTEDFSAGYQYMENEIVGLCPIDPSQNGSLTSLDCVLRAMFDVAGNNGGKIANYVTTLQKTLITFRTLTSTCDAIKNGDATEKTREDYDNKTMDAINHISNYYVMKMESTWPDIIRDSVTEYLKSHNATGGNVKYIHNHDKAISEICLNITGDYYKYKVVTDLAIDVVSTNPNHYILINNNIPSVLITRYTDKDRERAARAQAWLDEDIPEEDMTYFFTNDISKSQICGRDRRDAKRPSEDIGVVDAAFLKLYDYRMVSDDRYSTVAIATNNLIVSAIWTPAITDNDEMYYGKRAYQIKEWRCDSLVPIVSHGNSDGIVYFLL